MVTPELPFLRSPPFPGIAPNKAAISHPNSAEGDPASDALLAQLVAARVGGSFWGRQHGGFRVVMRQGATMPADFATVPRADIGIVATRQTGARRIAGPLLPADSDPWSLVEHAHIICASPDDELALVAALLDKPVFAPSGVPVSTDDLRAQVTARIAAARYRNCFTGEEIDDAAAIALLADWRRHIDGNRGIAAASGMAFWKREAIGRFLWDGSAAPPFLPPARGLRRAKRTGGSLAVWPSRVPPSLPVAAKAKGVAIARVEDGFLRSKGLGAALVPPGSVVVDRSGIYYDARGANDLETLLARHDFTPEIEQRARRLRQRICARNVTKYGQSGDAMIDVPAGRRVVLAVGQVDDDLSVKWGGAGIGGNLDFLERVRAAERDAWIIYRPHPDVAAGHRKGHLTRAAVLAHADAIDEGSPLMALVQAVDEVHVLSSLTGFEALMRDRPVTVHGMPFYAGWGLTRDLASPTGRRGRALTLDQLVAGALILYPRYLDPQTRLPCGPELMVERMTDGSTPATSWLIRLREWQGKLRRFMTLSAERLHG